MILTKSRLWVLFGFLNFPSLVMAEECPEDISSRVFYPNGTFNPTELSRSAYLESNRKKIQCQPFLGFDWYELNCSNGAIIYQTDDFCIEENEKEDSSRRCSDFVFVIDKNGSEFKMNKQAETREWICEETIATHEIQLTAYQSAFSFNLVIRQSFRFKPPTPVVGF